MTSPSLFKWRHFEADIILCAVHWYLRYALSYRDVEELLRERGVWVDHTTVFRWVQYYAPELDKRCRPSLPATNDSYKAMSTVCPHCGAIINHDNYNRTRYLDEIPSPHTRGASEAGATFQRDVEEPHAQSSRGA